MTARAVMVLGTASHVGKSVLATALCRILADDGYRVAPFKAQNMSLNSAPTFDGREIGRAQALQAEAARIAPSVDMNPILLKPTSHASSQIVLLGKVHGVASAADYHLRRVEEYFPLVVAAYQRLAAAHDVIVLEGAGSPAEINLKAHDIVNLRMAEAADARCLLVGDIDRGGVFAALVGTLALLDPPERARIGAFAINKFRGDAALLAPGVTEIERRTELPCAGVVPWLDEIGLEEEDSVALDEMPRLGSRGFRERGGGPDRRLRVAVLAVPYLSNATDFPPLAAEPGVELAYADRPDALDEADVVILPGTKDTLGAIAWLHERGLAEAVRAFAGHGLVFGICGGLQMLGRRVSDPLGIERGGTQDGLGLLPIVTELGAEKTTRRVHVRLSAGAFFGVSNGVAGTGYEIHMGRSQADWSVQPFATLAPADGAPPGTQAELDGAVSESRRVAGSYVHGLFADDGLRHAFIAAARTACRLAPARALEHSGAQRDARFARLAAHVRAALRLETIFC